jgi:hypothetical protein
MTVTLAVFRKSSKNKGSSLPHEIAISDRIASITVITPVGQSFVQALFPVASTQYIAIKNDEKIFLEGNFFCASIDAKLAAHIKRFGRQANTLLRDTLNASAAEMMKADVFSDNTMYLLNPVEEVIVITRFIREYVLAKKRLKKTMLVSIPDKKEIKHHSDMSVETLH